MQPRILPRFKSSPHESIEAGKHIGSNFEYIIGLWRGNLIGVLASIFTNLALECWLFKTEFRMRRIASKDFGDRDEMVVCLAQVGDEGSFGSGRELVFGDMDREGAETENRKE